MPLVQCSSCSHEISADAEACPKCGHPQKPRKRRSISTTRRIVGVVVLLVIVIVFYNVFVSDETKDGVNTIAGSTGVAARLIPWVDRADTSVRRMLEGENRKVVAQSIQGITHPTGSDPVMREYEVRKVGDRLSTRFVVDWRGGILRTQYTTVVVWELGKDHHSKASILSDNAAFAVEPANAKQLDDWFRNELYPTLRSYMGN